MGCFGLLIVHEDVHLMVTNKSTERRKGSPPRAPLSLFMQPSELLGIAQPAAPVHKRRCDIVLERDRVMGLAVQLAYTLGPTTDSEALEQ